MLYSAAMRPYGVPLQRRTIITDDAGKALPHVNRGNLIPTDDLAALKFIHKDTAISTNQDPAGEWGRIEGATQDRQADNL